MGIPAAQEFHRWHYPAVPYQIDWNALRNELVRLAGKRSGDWFDERGYLSKSTYYRVVNIESEPSYQPTLETIGSWLIAVAPKMLPAGSFVMQFEPRIDLKDGEGSDRTAASTNVEGGSPYAQPQARAVSPTDQSIVDALYLLSDQLLEVSSRLSSTVSILRAALLRIADRSLSETGTGQS